MNCASDNPVAAGPGGGAQRGGEESSGAARRAHGRPAAPAASWSTTSGGAGSPAWNAAWDAPPGLGEPLPGAEPDGAVDGRANGATEGDADGANEASGDGEADGAIDGEATTTSDGDGVGRRPTGSGPTKTNAARTPAATSTPTRRPARIARADFMRREGTSTDGPKAGLTGRW